MRYAVMIAARTGTRRLVSTGSSTYWEDQFHTITFTIEDTPEAADLTVEDLRRGFSGHTHHIWVEARP